MAVQLAPAAAAVPNKILEFGDGAVASRTAEIAQPGRGLPTNV